MSTEFTHIKIVPTAVLLDGDFAKNADESIRQEKIARAAPELLEALKDAVKVMELFMENDGYIAVRVGLARAAINKATS